MVLNLSLGPFKGSLLDASSSFSGLHQRQTTLSWDWRHPKEPHTHFPLFICSSIHGCCLTIHTVISGWMCVSLKGIRAHFWKRSKLLLISSVKKLKGWFWKSTSNLNISFILTTGPFYHSNQYPTTRECMKQLFTCCFCEGIVCFHNLSKYLFCVKSQCV